MRFIVKNHTVLQHLYHRSPLKAIGRLKHIHTKLQFTIDGSRKKMPPGTKGQLPGTKRVLHRSKSGALRNKLMLGGRRIFPIDKTINLIIKQNDVQINITTNSMNKVLTSGGNHITVAVD